MKLPGDQSSAQAWVRNHLLVVSFNLIEEYVKPRMMNRDDFVAMIELQ